ncbi:YgfZ/GcvT domain-containing protein [Gloeobacter morelensis]|uniref:Folate-binding protein YgfZ n=1 Tax=Gloeobacter morelensis MG652769 TaxID=2781736 RepID=A0ABY3PL72_9CYAN|nr:glycine cleavage T C-terminal barrel domain-containing protein [Gloeobacter morelensis]UFP94324.1 folate-binding protein YgfZ [Gloeobacter morelensis MG652769]
MSLEGYFPSDRELLSVRGKDAADYLQRVLTCNLKTLQPGKFIPGALLTGQGKLVAFFDLYQQADGGYTLAVPSGCAETLAARLERYVFSEDVVVEPREAIVLELLASGPPFEPIPEPGRYCDFALDGLPARLSALAPGYYRLELVRMPSEFAPAPLEAERFEAWRIEQGLPAWDKELNDNLIPLNLGIDGAISHDKGCYTGQEVISRATFVGHPAQELVGLLAEEPLKAGTELTLNGDYVGLVTSTSYSETRQASIGLARTRWRKAKPGERVQAGEREVGVVGLPFAP